LLVASFCFGKGLAVEVLVEFLEIFHWNDNRDIRKIKDLLKYWQQPSESGYVMRDRYWSYDLILGRFFTFSGKDCPYQRIFFFFHD